MSIPSMHELRSSSFLPGLFKPLLPSLDSLSLSPVTIEQQLYPLERPKPTQSFDVGFRVARLNEFRYRVDIGFFSGEEKKPKMLGALEQSFCDDKQRTIRVPRVVRQSLMQMYTQKPSKRFPSL